MKVLNLLTSGGVGGIEVLCRDIASGAKAENVFCFLFGEGLIYDQMKNAGNTVYSFDHKKLSGRKLRELKEIAKECDIIVVHHDDPFLQMYYLSIMKSFPNKKYISIVHHCYDPVADNLGYGITKRTIKNYLIARMFRKSNKVVFVSNAGYKSYADHYTIDKSKVEIVYNGISESKLHDGKNIKKDRDSVIRLSYVGRLVELKGVDKLIEVLPDLKSKYDFYLDIVGDGKSRQGLEERVRRLGVEDRVSFHGFQNNVGEYLRKTDIFVYPSKTEIFGLSLVEAMAYKCICVANNVGGIPEIIDDKVNGFLNFDNTTNGLYKTICEAIQAYNDDKLRTRIMDEARRTACMFSINKTIDSLENIYKETLES